MNGLSCSLAQVNVFFFGKVGQRRNKKQWQDGILDFPPGGPNLQLINCLKADFGVLGSKFRKHTFHFFILFFREKKIALWNSIEIKTRNYVTEVWLHCLLQFTVDNVKILLFWWWRFHAHIPKYVWVVGLKYSFWWYCVA